jgi:predicted nucleic acid-binding protein
MSSCASSMASTPFPIPTRVFIDTSVLFAAALSETGFARDLLVAGTRGELVVVLSAFVIEETRRNLAIKASSALPFFETFLALELVHVVDPPASLVRQVATDIALKDAPIVAAAIHAETQFLAS